MGHKSTKRMWRIIRMAILFTFLQARTIFFRSYSLESPWIVVRVFRPFRCWIRMWTRPSWDQFHTHCSRSFYTHKSQMCKKTVKSSVSFWLLEFAHVKTSSKMLMKLAPGPRPHHPWQHRRRDLIQKRKF